MPYKDPADKRRWVERNRDDINKRVYARRKVRMENEQQFRKALIRIAGGEENPVWIATSAINMAQKREEEGQWKKGRDVRSKLGLKPKT